MPVRKTRRGGSGHIHTSKAKRQAQHIASSERKRGMSAKRAKQIGWATVHKNRSHKSREKRER
ncbi:MAG: hypothetical protein PXY39_14630 [archaeon]|nr:hypothetical protein [archaeon]